MKLASRTVRLLAQFVDGIVGAVPVVIVFIITRPEDRGSDATTFLMVTGMAFWIGYYFFADSLPGGQSFGKRLFGIAVVDHDSNEACSPFQSFLRNLVASVGVLDWVFIFGKRRQRLGDLAAGTIVVKEDDTGFW